MARPRTPAEAEADALGERIDVLSHDVRALQRAAFCDPVRVTCRDSCVRSFTGLWFAVIVTFSLVLGRLLHELLWH